MKKRVLIVDDDIMTLKILKKYLEEEYEVITENAGYRFVEKMDTYNADLILLDIEMPVINGLQAFEKMIGNPKLKDVPVAFLSGVSSPNLVRELMQKGAAGYIIKTTPKGELLERVRKIFDKSGHRKNSVEILILHDDTAVLKNMRDTLTGAGYRVKVVRNMLEATEYIIGNQPALFIIGHDEAGVGPNAVYESLESIMKKNRVAGIVMDVQFFSQELLDRVSTALGEN